MERSLRDFVSLVGVARTVEMKSKVKSNETNLQFIFLQKVIQHVMSFVTRQGGLVDEQPYWASSLYKKLRIYDSVRKKT